MSNAAVGTLTVRYDVSAFAGRVDVNRAQPSRHTPRGILEQMGETDTPLISLLLGAVVDRCWEHCSTDSRSCRGCWCC